MNRVIPALLALALLLGAAPQQRFSIDAMQRIVDLSSAVISPDGARVAFVESRVDTDRNRYDDSLVVYDRATGRMQTVSQGHDTVDSVAWSPDGSALAAVMNDAASGADQLYAIDLAAGSSRQLTNGKADVDQIAWSPNGSEIAFSRPRYVPPKQGAAAFRDAFRVSDNAYLVTKAPQPVDLFLVSLGGAEHRVFTGPGSVADSPLSWSPDSTRILYELAPSGVYGIQDRAVLRQLDLRTGKISAPTPARAYQDNGLFSPDGKRVAYRYNRGGDPVNEPEAYVDGEDVSRALDLHVETFSWMPGSTALLLQVYERAAAPLYVQPLRGTARRLSLGAVVSASIQSAGSVARDGTIAFIGEEAGRPSEVYVLPPNAARPQRLTNLNAAIAALELGRTARISWRFDGRSEDGVLTYPPGFVRGRKYPLVLRIHGGPTLSSMTAFDPFYQLAAARGYVVFAPNYRGSNDLGNAYERAIFNDASIGPGRDVMAGIRAVEALGMVDESRIGVSGWSYGGQLDVLDGVAVSHLESGGRGRRGERSGRGLRHRRRHRRRPYCLRQRIAV